MTLNYYALFTQYLKVKTLTYKMNLLDFQKKMNLLALLILKLIGFMPRLKD